MILKSCNNGNWSSPDYRTAALELCLDYDKKVVSFDLVTHGNGRYDRTNIPSFAEALECYRIAEEWVDGKRDGDLFEDHLWPNGHDEFSQRFDLVWSVLAQLPNKPSRFWYDGENILCKTEDEAETIANFIDDIIGDSCTHTGYYDPKEDERSGEVDDHTGYYYVDFD